jgi:hypothetical protein
MDRSPFQEQLRGMTTTADLINTNQGERVIGDLRVAEREATYRW